DRVEELLIALLAESADLGEGRALRLDAHLRELSEGLLGRRGIETTPELFTDGLLARLEREIEGLELIPAERGELDSKAPHDVALGRDGGAEFFLVLAGLLQTFVER